MVNVLYQEYLITILRHLASARQQTPAPSNINLAIAMTKYMHANYNKNITLQDIETFSMSRRAILTAYLRNILDKVLNGHLIFIA